MDGIADEAKYIYGEPQRHAKPTDPSPVVAIKHCDYKDLFKLKAFDERARIPLASFISRYFKSGWMQAQFNYLQKAVIAAAHRTLDPIFIAQDCGAVSVAPSGFDALDFLNCGRSLTNRHGEHYFFRCRQPYFCPSCNRWQRVEPAKSEFIPHFEKVPAWWGFTLAGRSSPLDTGVKVRSGVDENGELIYDYLFRLYGRWPKLPKFGVGLWDDPFAPIAVADGIHEFSKWLTNNRYFDGLHVVFEAKLNFFPDSSSCTGVGHTVHVHAHGYGNTSKVFDKRRAKKMWLGFLFIMRDAGLGELFAYPDIELRSIHSPEELSKVIDYTLKPIDFVAAYLGGLQHGCPVANLNLEFHQTLFDCEVLFPGSVQGEKFGNMNLKSRHRYVWVPQSKPMTTQQVKRYLERREEGSSYDWEMLRYENHLKNSRKRAEWRRKRAMKLSSLIEE